MSSGKGRRRWLEPEAVIEAAGEDAGRPDGIAAFMDEVRAAGAAKGRPGRPRGAKNRKSAELEARWAEAGHADPALFLGAIMSLDPVALQHWIIANDATLAGLSEPERTTLAPSLSQVMAMQASCAEKVLPYLHGKQATRIQIEDERLPTFIVDLGSDRLADLSQAARDMALSIGIRAEDESEENQGLGAAVARAPHDATPHDEDN
jgi:hypothetical protein